MRSANVIIATVVAAVLCAGSACAAPPHRFALLVGIDRYTPTDGHAADTTGRIEWTDLDGCVNDVVSVRDLLRARYGFGADEILLLTNALATRAAVMGSFRSRIIDGLQRGDRALFYYSGHGSQVVNSKSPEADHRDETIVPADANTGVPDIRDKELRRLYNEALDRGIVLTVVMDSCHSGSAARGMPVAAKSRNLPPDLRDVADGSDPGPVPEERGALILSAAQDYQLAREDIEEVDGQDISHGVFSLALIRTLRTMPPDMPAEDVFLRARALIKGRGWSQEPVLAGTSLRRETPLFAEGKASAGTRLLVPVLEVYPSGEVVLQGGHAIGLAPGCELVAAATDRVTRLRVERVKNLSESSARVIKGDAATIAAGDFFEPVKWTVPDRVPLAAWIPSEAPTGESLDAARETLHAWATKSKLRWIEDPTEETPDLYIFWDGRAWSVTTTNGSARAIGPSLSDTALERVPVEEGASLFWNAPPPASLLRALRMKNADEGLVAFTDKSASATFALAGRPAGNGWAYAWIRPGALQAANTSPLPVRGDWVPGGEDETAGKLEADILRAARAKAWLDLDPPPDNGRFPFSLALRGEGAGPMRRNGTVHGGETYHLVLTADPARLARPYEQRFVYVFAMDSFGKRTLLFPPRYSGNVENRLPVDKKEKLSEIDLSRFVGGNAVRVSEPYGVDTYMLLTTVEPIPDLGVLTGEGIRTRGGPSPLAQLLRCATTRTRGDEAPAVPANWSIEKLSFQSMPAR